MSREHSEGLLEFVRCRQNHRRRQFSRGLLGAEHEERTALVDHVEHAVCPGRLREEAVRRG